MLQGPITGAPDGGLDAVMEANEAFEASRSDVVAEDVESEESDEGTEESENPEEESPSGD